MDIRTSSDGLTFDDILLLPGYTDFKRQDVSLAVQLSKSISLKLPVISSPMDTVSEEAMARSMGLAGGLGIIHRNLPPEVQAAQVKAVKETPVSSKDHALDEKGRLLVGAAVGIGKDFETRVEALCSAGADCIVIDSGHGNTVFMVEAIKAIRTKFPGAAVMAGNVATADGAKRLADAGAHIIRVGMGPGSICTTRIVTGMGVPQLTAIDEAVKAVKGSGVAIVADGGIRQIGDMAKALAVGAHAVMLGGLLAGFEQSPGDIVMNNGQKWKSYRGMGSVGAMQRGSAERYGQTRDTSAKKLIPEGVEGLVRYKGQVEEYLSQVSGSLRSSLYYIGAKTIGEFHAKAACIRITQASLTESHPHSIAITDAGTNYSL